MLGAWWVATHKLPGMGSVAVGVLGLVFLFALFFLGMPVAFALMATGLVFIANLRGVSASNRIKGGIQNEETDCGTARCGVRSGTCGL